MPLSLFLSFPSLLLHFYWNIFSKTLKTDLQGIHCLESWRIWKCLVNTHTWFMIWLEIEFHVVNHSLFVSKVIFHSLLFWGELLRNLIPFWALWYVTHSLFPPLLPAKIPKTSKCWFEHICKSVRQSIVSHYSLISWGRFHRKIRRHLCHILDSFLHTKARELANTDGLTKWRNSPESGHWLN